MLEKIILDYGAWQSPVSAASVAEGGVRLSDLRVCNGEAFWVEGRPVAGGRCTIVKYCDECRTIDVTPPEFNVRTAVHEYGGAPFAVADDGTVFFANLTDNRIYRAARGSGPVALTPTPEPSTESRYADLEVAPNGEVLFAVRETHSPNTKEPINELVAITTNGAVVTVATGSDFYAAPRVSPDGTMLAWLTWEHPDMPWDTSSLWLAPLAGTTVGVAQHIAGSNHESIAQPEWSPQGVLHFVSDRSGWWNVYQYQPTSGVSPVLQMAAEWAEPAWVFGMSRYGFLEDGTLVGAPLGGEYSGCIGTVTDGGFRVVTEISTDLTSVSYLKCAGDSVWFVGAGPTTLPAVVKWDFKQSKRTILTSPNTVPLELAAIATGRRVTFPTSDDGTAHAVLYMPCNPAFSAPAGTLPPLLVLSHGGPTSACGDALDLKMQFWTSRGFAVIDVDYRGSSGYGRVYRRMLDGKWGNYDVADCVAAANWATSKGLADAKALAIRGGSAGGYTTLCALTFYNVFAAAGSYYGVADVEALATDTHKFESRYLDRLIAPYPQHAEEYRRRSPLHFVHNIKCPVILFQGDKDKVVPPQQAESIVAALAKSAVPHAYLLFEGESHGFRQATNIIRALEAELSFYAQVFGFEAAGTIDQVQIVGL